MRVAHNNNNTGKVIEMLKRRLKEMLGLEIILDTYSLTKYKKRYLQLLIDQPEKAYNILVEVLGGNKNSANLILRYLLQPLVEDQRILDKALEELEKGNPEPLKQLLVTPLMM